MTDVSETPLQAVRLRDAHLLGLTRGALRSSRWWAPNRLTRVAEFEDVGGLRCVSGAQTLVELARDLTLVDLVPIVDCALRSGVTAEQIQAAVTRRCRGAATLRRALALADDRSESWWESILRLFAGTRRWHGSASRRAARLSTLTGSGRARPAGRLERYRLAANR